jgi:hypothetical protein
MDRQSRGILPAIVAGLVWLNACGGSSSTSVVGPTQGRCQISISQSGTSFGPTGGNGTLSIATARECAWSATAGASWIAVGPPTNGQGEAAVPFTVAPNQTPVTRRGTISIGSERIEISQEGVPCAFELSHTGETVGAAGRSGSVDVVTIDGCQWTALSHDPWIQVTAGANGTGSGQVRFTVAPNTGAGRTGELTIAGLRFAIVQEAPPPATCAYTVSPAQHTVAADGGPLVITVSAGPTCPWTATSNAPWIVVADGPTGQGNSTLRLSVAANAGRDREGTVTVGGQTVTVRQEAAAGSPPGPAPAPPPPPPPPPQPPACSYEVAPVAHAIAAGGAATSVTVTAAGGCAWSAASAVTWITVTEGGAGSGNGTVRFTVAANTGAARSGTLTIAGRAVTVNQAASAAPGPAPPPQPEPCAYTVAPTTHSAGAAGGQASSTVTAASGCTWTATSQAAWITITQGASGAGSGTVQFTIAANTGAARTGTITVAGQTVTVSQEAALPPPAEPCTYSVTPTMHDAGPDGGQASSNVTAASHCAWTAVSSVAWVTVTQGASGTGTGTVQFTIAANTGPARSGTLTIAGQTVTIHQDAAPPPPCTYGIAPENRDFPGSGGTGTVDVTAAAGCAWTATSHEAWITIVEGSNGNGAATVTYLVALNPGGTPRQGSLTIAGLTHRVQQQGSPTVEIEGRVSGLEGSCPNLRFAIRGQTILTNSATRYDDGSCFDIRNGLSVEVEGIRQADGTLLAIEIEID